MSAHAQARSTSRRRPRSRRWLGRRRLALLATVVLSTIAATAVLSPWADKAVKEVTLPLRHDDVIRQQAADKRLDPALIAGVIYVESRFRDQTSHAGAKGLMQLMPGTADYIATKSGGTEFEQGDLADAQINISYGSWYLRYLQEKYHGNVILTLAAYNAGEGAVSTYGGVPPYAETQAYVAKVLVLHERYSEALALQATPAHPRSTAN